MSVAGANWNELYLYDAVVQDGTEWYPGAFSHEPPDPGMLTNDESGLADPVRFVYEVKKGLPLGQTLGVMSDQRFLSRILWYRAALMIVEQNNRTMRTFLIVILQEEEN